MSYNYEDNLDWGYFMFHEDLDDANDVVDYKLINRIRNPYMQNQHSKVTPQNRYNRQNKNNTINNTIDNTINNVNMTNTNNISYNSMDDYSYLNDPEYYMTDDYYDCSPSYDNVMSYKNYNNSERALNILYEKSVIFYLAGCLMHFLKSYLKKKKK